MLPAVIGKILLEVAGPIIAKQVAAKIAKSPEAQNQINAEPALQSRVVRGSAMAFVPAFAYCIYAIFSYRFDFGRYVADPMLAIAIPAAAGGFYSLYGRLRGGLKPIGS
jgi:hypothetical protein